MPSDTYHNEFLLLFKDECLQTLELSPLLKDSGHENQVSNCKNWRRRETKQQLEKEVHCLLPTYMSKKTFQKTARKQDRRHPFI